MAKILVVDDQLGVRLLLLEVFREEQHEVETVANGKEALKLFPVFQPDLVLMDMKMPIMNGFETLKGIWAMNRRVSVILMTACCDVRDIGKREDSRGLYYVDKPFDLFELKEQVRRILAAA